MKTNPALFDEQPLISLHDEQVTAVHLLTQADAQLAQRETPDLQWPSYSAAAMPELPPHSYELLNLHHTLRLANEGRANFDTAPLLAASAAVRIPIIGRLWQIIRQEAHNLVLFYVNRAVTQQTQFNHNLVQTLNELSRLTIAQQQEIKALRQQLAEREKGQ